VKKLQWIMRGLGAGMAVIILVIVGAAGAALWALFK